jgi:CRP-like cAMP-binding protein
VTSATRAAEHLVTNQSFSRLSPVEASDFLDGGRVRSFGIGEVLLREGDHGETMIVVTAGQIEVRLGDYLLAVLGPGDTLGEMSLIDPGPRSATAVARRSGTLIEIQREAFDARLAAGDKAAIKALQSITETVFSRLVSVNEQVRDEVLTPRGNVFTRLWRGIRSRGRNS